MDTKRLIVFIALSFGILYFWQHYMEQRYPQLKTPATASSVAASGASQASATASTAAAPEAGRLAKGQRITVTTDLLSAVIDTNGADLREVKLLKLGETKDPKKPFTLLQDEGEHIYVAQSGLLGDGLPTHKSIFTSAQSSYTLAEGQNEVVVRLENVAANGVKVAKIYTFKRDKYLVDVKYEIVNGSNAPVTTSAYYRLVRDGKVENPGMFGTHTFTGPAVYTEEGKFQKVDFEKIRKGEAKYVPAAKDGWIAMIQHYFVSGWIFSPKEGSAACTPNACRYEMKALPDNLFAVSATIDLPAIAAGQKLEKSVPLYLGPQESKRLDTVATGFDLVKDYGMFTIFSKPLFAVLQFIHSFIGNWGWSIIIVTLLLKAAFFPLASASYRSMAKMRQLAPRMEALKQRHGEDRVKFQQAVMEMYKTEKVNPLGGCLPMLVQIPVFIAFYWMLLAAVELRQAPWEFWIHDLSIPDPYYILPLIMAVSMYVQSSLSPPPPDPMQAKMMKWMPLAFSVFFFFFPAGLVLYWVVNNILSIAQQYVITKQIEKQSALAKNS
ncbi:membrane protein insertase YidC [Chitinibacter bivalviorum]|uniref:Membrane protein insertase YidC n=1 Tax=Chitinibacter bivalviorum TaxID=2739434 RepID=A0A7H9BM09_9NEIS|nr:membrane protein insertase YidC [Chitinibacter bivalviorum]QLG89482.1 membrane protein insertase YidC [Chitinibacter bivalviorum]